MILTIAIDYLIRSALMPSWHRNNVITFTSSKHHFAATKRIVINLAIKAPIIQKKLIKNTFENLKKQKNREKFSKNFVFTFFFQKICK